MRIWPFAALLVLGLTSAAKADELSDATAELGRLTAHYTDNEKAFAAFAGWDITNSNCKARIGESVWDSPGSSTILIAGLLSASADQLPPGRASEIYDFLWNWQVKKDGPVHELDPAKLKTLCAEYRVMIKDTFAKSAK